MNTEAAIATAIFLVALLLILSDRIDRTITSIAGAVLMVAAGVYFGFFTEAQATASVDFETIGLLFGMMTLVALLVPTGAFEYFAIRAAIISRGRPVALLVLLGAVTTVLSMFLDNVTTVVLIAPVTVLVTEILGLSPVPYLIGEALLSNSGGVATLIGHPPNVLIGSAAGLSFNDFLVHALPLVSVAWIATLIVLIWLFRDLLHVVPANPEVLDSLNPSEAMTDLPTARKMGIVFAVTLLLFLVQGPLGITPAFVAIGMAAIGLLWLRPTIEELLGRIEWTVLLFFIGLFIMVGGLESSGALDVVKRAVLSVSELGPQVTGIAIVWLSAVLSALVVNVPIAVALIPVIQSLGDAGVNTFPLWWALAFGTGFGGNATIIGSMANMIVVQISGKTREPISSTLWMRRGLPVTVVTCIIASVAFLVAFPMFTR